MAATDLSSGLAQLVQEAREEQTQQELAQQELAQQQGEDAAIGQAEALPGTEEDEDDVQEESEERRRWPL